MTLVNHLENSIFKQVVEKAQGNYCIYKIRSSNWWWITLLVLAGIGIVGGLGLFAYKKVKGKNV